ncbi:MAG: 2-C-methyl-D-erythritol 4-phosphate cytidylyltransferase [Flavobacteriales bacterium]|nr:2-C-methyl-D-erythritol 4-phosphate cytidylyltransferase [Flavobacteriales bacterium]
MKKTMIIVAGGSGTRMGASIPKQFIELLGKPILMHTLEKLHAIGPLMELILVLPKTEMRTWEQLCEKHNFDIPHSITEGGETRFESVQNGLAKVTDSELVGVHDGVRPFVSAQVINACFSSAARDGAAIPVVAIVQSLRKMEGEKSKAVNRNDFRAVQTPQCFQTTILKKAFAQAERTDFSDDASVVEAAGYSIKLVEGNTENIKLTTPTDLAWAKLMLEDH